MTRRRSGPGNVPGPLAATYYAQRASAGLIVSEAALVCADGASYPGSPGHLRRRVARRVARDRERGAREWRADLPAALARRALLGSRVPRRCAPGGAVGHRDPRRGDASPSGGRPFVAPRALDADELPGLVRAFADGARNARRGRASTASRSTRRRATSSISSCATARTGATTRTVARSSVARASSSRSSTPSAAACGASRVGVQLSPTSTLGDMSDSDPEATFGFAAAALGRARPRVPARLRTARARSAPSRRRMRGRFRGAFVANGGYDGATAERRDRERAKRISSRSAAPSSRTPISSAHRRGRAAGPRPIRRPSTAAARAATPTTRTWSADDEPTHAARSGSACCSTRGTRSRRRPRRCSSRLPRAPRRLFALGPGARSRSSPGWLVQLGGVVTDNYNNLRRHGDDNEHPRFVQALRDGVITFGQLRLAIAACYGIAVLAGLYLRLRRRRRPSCSSGSRASPRASPTRRVRSRWAIGWVSAIRSSSSSSGSYGDGHVLRRGRVRRRGAAHDEHPAGNGHLHGLPREPPDGGAHDQHPRHRQHPRPRVRPREERAHARRAHRPTVEPRRVPGAARARLRGSRLAVLPRTASARGSSFLSCRSPTPLVVARHVFRARRTKSSSR